MDLGDRRLGELEVTQRRPQEQLAAADPVLADAPSTDSHELGVGVGAGDDVPGTEALAVGLDDHDLDLVVGSARSSASSTCQTISDDCALAFSGQLSTIRAIGAVLLVEHDAEVDRVHGPPFVLLRFNLTRRVRFGSTIAADPRRVMDRLHRHRRYLTIR